MYSYFDRINVENVRNNEILSMNGIEKERS